MSKDKPNVVYCYSHVCHLGAAAAFQFPGMGYPVIEMDGGFKAWEENDLVVVPGQSGRPTAKRENTRAVAA